MFHAARYLLTLHKCCHNDVIAENKECLPNPCVHGECVDNIDGYVCICQAGFTGNNCQTSQYICLENGSHFHHSSQPTIDSIIQPYIHLSYRPSIQPYTRFSIHIVQE